MNKPFLITSKSEKYYSAFFQPKRVVILSKQSQLEANLQRIKVKNKFKENEDLLFELEKVNSNINDLKIRHEQQKLYVKEICDELKSHNIEFKVVDLYSFSSEIVDWSDLVISAGGDGTFLAAASKVRNDIPVIGINTDPVGSEGHLCLTGKSNRPANEVIRQFLNNNFSSDEDSDCKTNLTFSIKKPYLALNEVFFAESHTASVSSYDVKMDDSPFIKQKSSGITICTGTGSTSWHYNINRLTEQTLKEIIDIANSMGLYFMSLNNKFDNKNMNNLIIEEICKRFNQNLIFQPEDKKMAFSIREPVFNATFPKTSSRGFIERIQIRSKCRNAYLILDGSNSIPFNRGSEVLLDIHSEDTLKTAKLL